LDGTIILSDDIYYHIWNEILIKYNIYLTYDIFKNYIQGNSDNTVIKALMPNLNFNIDHISNMKDRLFNENIDKIKIIDGAISFMKTIKMHGHKIVIVTNCNRSVAENIIKKIKINKLIDGLIIGSECKRSKPYPDPYIQACNLFTNKTDNSYVFEDSKTGILSGRNINPKCLVGIKTLYDEDTLKNLGVNIFIDNYIEDNLYEKIMNYEHNKNAILKEYIYNSYKENIKEIIIYDEKIKGGYISDVIKIIIHLDDGKIKECVLKLENKNETKLSIMANKLGLYEREYYFYESISKYVNIDIPKFYSIIKDNQFNDVGILMENINKDNFVLNLNLNKESIDVSLKIIDTLAKLHSKFWNKNLENIFKNLLKNNDSKFNPVWRNYVNSNWISFKNKWNHLLNEKQIEIGEKIVQNFQQIQDELSDKNLTLCHGDSKSPNIFYKKIKENQYTPYFIDWQYISNGKGIQDIVFLMIESYDIDKIDVYCPIFKNYYYQKLIEYGVNDYNYSDFEKDFVNSICYFPFFVAIWFGNTPEEDLIDKNFPFFFIMKLFNFIEKYVHL
jgi:HAD superfamily hydrolase (TIGR01509 family)